MKKLRIPVFFVLFLSGKIYADYPLDIRNIASFTCHNLSVGNPYHIWEDALILKTAEKLSWLVKIYRDNRETWSNNIYYFGSVLNVTRTAYLELDYGYGRDSDKKESNYLIAEITNETDKYLYGIGIKHGQLESSAYDVLSPFGNYSLNKKLRIRARYYFTRDSDKKFDHSLLAETEYILFKYWKLNAGFTIGDRLIDSEYAISSEVGFYSFFAGIGYQFMERFQFKYVLEQLFQKNQINDIKNTIIADIRF